MPPLKALASYQFQISVKNNDDINYTVSIDKGAMLPIDSWVTIQNNSQSLIAKGTITFLLTLAIPAGTQALDYTLVIMLNAKDNINVTHSVIGKYLKLIIDNSSPEIITENIDYTTSSTIRVTFDGYDGRSSEYSNFNYGVPGSGYQGIKSFTLVLKSPAGSVIETKSFDATTQLTRAYVFTSSVLPNTIYTATVQAVDMAGNSGTSTPKEAKTKVGIPTNFIVASSSYCRLTLAWDAMPGATTYNIWIDLNSVFSTSATTYTFNNLSPGTAYAIKLKAMGIDGSGDITSKSFSTPAVSEPRFLGSLSICNGSQTIQVRLVSDAISYDWIVSSPLTINGAQSCTTTSNSVNVQTNGYQGNSEISVTANTSCGISSNTAIGVLRIGAPRIGSNYPLAFYDGSTYNDVCNLQNYSTSMNIQNADYVEWTRIAANPTSTSWYQSGDNLKLYFFAVNQTAAFNVYASNTCGSLNNQFGFKSINCGGGGGCLVTYSAYPNPASQSTKVTPNIPAPCDPILQTAVINGTVSVYDKQGIKKKSLTYKGYQDMNIDVSDLKDGLYYINIFNGTTTSSVSLIVKH